MKSNMQLSIERFLGFKDLVDSKTIMKKEACKYLGITPYTYNKLSATIDNLKQRE